MNKNYRLRDLMIDKISMDLLNEISEGLNWKNTDLARYLLKDKLMEIKRQGLENYRLAIVGTQKRKK